MAFTIRHTATALTAATLALCGSAIAAEKTLKIYGFGAKSGVVGIFGQQSEAAMQAAANIINKNGGVTLGDGTKAQLAIEYLDDRCNAEEGINALRRIASLNDSVAITSRAWVSSCSPAGVSSKPLECRSNNWALNWCSSKDKRRLAAGTVIKQASAARVRFRSSAAFTKSANESISGSMAIFYLIKPISRAPYASASCIKCNRPLLKCQSDR